MTQGTQELKISSPKPNVVGIYNERIDFFEFEKMMDVQAVLCSSNPEKKFSNDLISLTCTSNMNSNKDLKAGAVGMTFTIDCPA